VLPDVSDDPTAYIFRVAMEFKVSMKQAEIENSRIW
jgi:hypothetical protein